MLTTPALDEAQPAMQFLDDPLRAFEQFAFRQTFYPLGFAVEIETNHPYLLAVASLSWPSPAQEEPDPPLRLRIGITPSPERECPPSPVVRAQHHLLSIVADAENFIVCDLTGRFAFGWLTSAALFHPSYLRYCLLEAAVMCLMSSAHVTPLHAACVSFAGRGFLLQGRSGAGKSTLAYACAREGWTYTSDDCSHLLWDTEDLRVRGNCNQFRFRPTARGLFPELQGRSLTPRVEGKPSIEVPTSELPHIITAPEATVHAFITLRRHASPCVALTRLSAQEALPLLEQALFPLQLVRELQRPSLKRVLEADLYTLHYRDLAPAIKRLKQLATDGK